ncbi:MAG: methionine adenosyltransferase domain-containing protein [Candidatus Saccharimonadales bacterium]
MSISHPTQQLLRTAESVSPKHPDKLCDQISDAILDAYLQEDPAARVAVEATGGHGKVFVVGEVTSSARIAIEPIVKRIAGEVEVEVRLVQQSPEIAHGVDAGGAGDQGIMVGYATNETPELLPLEVVLARSLNQYLYKRWPYDGKTQVTLKAGELKAIVASFQHAPHAELEAAVKEWARTQTYVSKCFVKYCNVNPTLHINPAGDWEVGGFDADTGLTGRKLVVDNYGPRIPIGGGCFSGKDASKVDRSAAYMARKIAVDYLARFQANEVFVYLAYAIGYDQPVQATAIVDGETKVIEGYDLSPRGIVAKLTLTQPQFEQTARYGHFGHTDFSWEKPLKEAR